MNARELLKDCRAALLRGQADEQMAMVAGIDLFLAAPSESAIEAVKKIRERKYTGVCAHCGEAHGIHQVHGDDGNLYCRGSNITQYEPGYTTLTDTEAAALIEGLQRRVPSIVLKEYADLHFRSYDLRIDKDGLQKRTMDAIAAKHGVVIE